MNFCLYYILPSLCAKAPESLVWRLLYPLDHYYKVTPLHLIALRVLVIHRQFEASCLKAFHIHHHTTILGMKQFHQLAALPDEDEHVTVSDVASHLLMHHTAERTDSLTHVCTSRAQPVAHRVVKAEHGSPGFCPTDRVTRPPYHCQSGHEAHWETKVLHRKVRNSKKQDLHVL